MSVLVLSVILLTLAPTVTKRVNDNISINSIKTKGALFLINEAEPTACTIISDDGTADERNCTLTLPDDVTQINAVVVGNGGNGSNAVAGGSEIHIIEEISSSQNITFSPVMEFEGKNYFVKDLKIDYMVSGGAGGGAGWGETSLSNVEEPQSQEECNELAGQDRNVSNSEAITFFLLAKYNGTNGKNICVAKYNVGDTSYGGPPIADTVRTDCTYKDNSDYCCYTGTTSDSSTCAASGTWGSYTTNYSSCDRTVCKWYAANKSCYDWAPNTQTKNKWRLPKSNELKGWISQFSSEKSKSVGIITQYLGDNGLQLCDGNATSYGSLTCVKLSGGCSGAKSNECTPNYVWSMSNGSTYGGYSLDKGSSYSTSSNNPDAAYSARCVYGPTSNMAYSGAGGGSGSSYANRIIYNGVLEEDTTIEITIGQGGSGGTSSSNATNGGDTTVKFGDKSIIVYGNPDNNASTVAYGRNGTSTNYGSSSSNYVRRYFNGTSNLNGSSNSNKLGKNGTKTTLSETQTATGGAGGKSDYLWGVNGATGTRTWASAGGSGGSLSDPNGQDGQYPGSGGGGGTAIIDENGDLVLGNGGKGADGVVILSYTLEPFTSAGAGGAAAGMVVARGIQISPDEPISVSFKPTTLNINNDLILETVSGQDANGEIAGVASEVGATVTNLTNRRGNFEIKEGEDGKQGGEIEGTTFLFGGVGGASPTGAQGGCGGLNTYILPDGTTYINDKKCLLNIPTEIEVNGSDGTFNVIEKNVVSNSFGIAGTGGGGGGFGTDALNNPIQGQGGKGGNGYVYIWWVDSD